MIPIVAPDGSEVHFPDGTDDATIKTVMAKNYGGPPAQPGMHSDPGTVGVDEGVGKAAAYGFSDNVPFGNRITSGIAAVGARPFSGDIGVKELYDQAQADTKTTQDAHPVANLAGNAAGVAATLPLASAKVIGGGVAAATGVRGAINEIPNALSAIGNFARSGKAAEDAGIVAKAGSLALRSGKSAAVAAPVGALYGAGSAEPGQKIQGAERGAGVAAGIGAALPVAGAALGAAASTVSPRIEQGTAALAQRARDFGIPLRLDQVSPTRVRNTLQKVSQEVPFSGVDQFENGQRQAFTQAVAKTLGQNATDLGPETINNYISDASSKFNDAFSGSTINFGQKDLNRIGDITQSAKDNLTGDIADLVDRNVQKFLNDSNFQFGQGRTIPGEKLASLRSDLVKRLPRMNSQAKPYIADLIDTIDDVAHPQIGPAKAGDLQQARYQWRNFKTIEPLLEKSTNGQIDPTQLMNQVSSSKYIKASRSEVGQDDLVDLARVGKQFLPKKGGSDTFQKSALMVGGGGAAVEAIHNPLAALAGVGMAGAGMAANRGFQAVNSSQKLIDLALKNSSKAAKQLTPPATALLPGMAGRKGNP